ncbi:TetR/AcrR family transcriptional regulator [Streptomyces hirsutus]
MRRAVPEPGRPTTARLAHSVLGLLNSAPHLARPGSLPGSLPGRATTAALLHRMARGAFAAAGSD